LAIFEILVSEISDFKDVSEISDISILEAYSMLISGRGHHPNLRQQSEQDGGKTPKPPQAQPADRISQEHPKRAKGRGQSPPGAKNFTGSRLLFLDGVALAFEAFVCFIFWFK
jgi:hypothetical protein